MTVAPPSNTVPPIDIAETIERARAAWQRPRAGVRPRWPAGQVLALSPGQADAMRILGLMAHAYGNLDL